jgi:hypothetical protein
MDLMAVTAERTTWFLGAAATAMVVEVIGEVVAWSRAWQRRRRRSGIVTAVKAEEEQDDSVFGHGSEGRADGVDDMDPTAAAAASKRAREILAA